MLGPVSEPGEDDDWRSTVLRLRAESNGLLRELFAGHAPLERKEPGAGDPAEEEPPAPR